MATGKLQLGCASTCNNMYLFSLFACCIFSQARVTAQRSADSKLLRAKSNIGLSCFNAVILPWQTHAIPSLFV
jgi:hypothetical protein